ncbi:MAG: DMT family transporter [Acidiferrobacter sp.]
MPRQSRFLSFVALGFLTVIWGYNWVIMKTALIDCPPLLFAALRVLLGALALWPVLVITKRPLSSPPIRYILPLGLLQSTGFIGLALAALEYGGAGPTAILVYMMPVWLMLLAWPLLGERIRGLQWPALILAILGLLCILRPGTQHAPVLGYLLALSSGIFWAASSLWQKRRAPAGLDLLTVTTWQMIFGGSALLILALAVDPLHVQWTPLFITALAYNAILGSALALVLWAYAIDRLPSGVAGMATLLSPLIGVIAAWLQLGERPGPWEGAGMISIFLALALVTWQHLRASQGLRAVRLGTAVAPSE